eukprot:gene7409-10100_t
MLDSSQYMYYISYAILCGSLGVAYIKHRSSETGTLITTKEFKTFQASFLTGYSIIILCELIAAASFYHTFIFLRLSLEQITRLYLVTVISTALTGVLADIIDIGSRKDKCVFAAMLYSISMFSIFFGGHYDMLLIGRIVFGAASSLHHSAFEAYAIHEHSSLGFPDDWLTQTFSFLTHSMALMAALSGIVGQIVAGFGPLGCAGFCCVIFGITGLYLIFMWEKDMNTPRFMLSNFLFNMSQTMQAVKSNKQMLLLFIISSLCETSITVFTFYWAPWINAIVTEGEGQQKIPYEILFSSFIVGSMLGNYLYQMYASQIGIENCFQAILFGSSVSYFLGAIFQTSYMAFGISVMVQICMGGYWPSIGYFRAKIILPEFRTMSLTIPSPMMMLTTCAALNGAAAYIQNTYLENRNTSDMDDEDDETQDEDDA